MFGQEATPPDARGNNSDLNSTASSVGDQYNSNQGNALLPTSLASVSAAAIMVIVGIFRYITLLLR